MKFRALDLTGTFLIDLEPSEDERGHFTKTFSVDAFQDQGIDMTITQSGTSFNRKKGTLRGLHYQRAPHEEEKLIRCVHGRVFDVAVDLRPSSPTFRRHVGLELREGDLLQVYLPGGIAHGFVTLEDNSEVVYEMSGHYVSEAADGVRWDDPAFGIEWPMDPVVISDRDRNWPLYSS